MTIRILSATHILVGAWFAATVAQAAEFPTPLPNDVTKKVETLPAKYPTGWAFLNYAGDRIELRNVGSDGREVKGATAGARFGHAARVDDTARAVYRRHRVVAWGARYADGFHHRFTMPRRSIWWTRSCCRAANAH